MNSRIITESKNKETQMTHKISVVLPCHNGEKYVKEAIESILQQTFDNFELLLIDDGSTDCSTDIIKSFKDKRICYIKNSENIGLIKTLNKGLDLATGEYIARMDADDISYPERFAEQVKLLDNNPDVVMCGTWINFFNYPPRKNDGHHPRNITYLSLLKGWCINHPTVMIRKSILDANNLRYDENYPNAEDYELWTRLIRYGRIVNIPQILLDYRWHENNISVKKEMEMKAMTAKIKQNMLDFLTEDKEQQQKLLEITRQPTKTRIPVFLISDENYAPMVLTTILSCLDNTKSAIDFYILSNKISFESQQKIYAGTKKYRNCTIEFIPVDICLFDKFKNTENYLNKTTYMRLLIPEIKPELNRVIYSDIDVIFTGDIKEIWQEELNDKIIGVVPDAYYQMTPNANNIYKRLELPRNHQYFYAGMILLDSAKWRKEGITKKMFELSEKFYDRILQADQDLLNIYFANNYKELDPKYEVSNLLVKYKKQFDKNKQKSISNPIIRHYESASKPWNSKEFQSSKMQDWKLWWKYAKKTPWYGELLKKYRSNNQ